MHHACLRTGVCCLGGVMCTNKSTGVRQTKQKKLTQFKENELEQKWEKKTRTGFPFFSWFLILCIQGTLAPLYIFFKAINRSIIKIKKNENGFPAAGGLDIRTISRTTGRHFRLKTGSLKDIYKPSAYTERSPYIIKPQEFHFFYFL